MIRLMYGDTARPGEVDHTAARKWWWYAAFTLRNSEIRTGLGVLCASSSFSLKVTWMMYINQSMTSNVLAISAITIVLLFLQRQDKQSQNSHRQCCTCITQQHILLMHLATIWDIHLLVHNKGCGLMNSITKDSSNICHWGKAELKTWMRTAQWRRTQQKERDARQGK